MSLNLERGTMPGANGFRRRAALLAILVSAWIAALAVPSRGATAAENAPLALSVTPLVLRADWPEAPRADRLAWRGGLELRSADRRFGGLSGLVVSPDGSRLTAVSDRGHWVAFAPRLDADGILAGLDAGVIAALRGPDGGPLRERWDRDAESLATMPDGALVVAFEHNHRLWRYGGGAGPLSGIPTGVPTPLPTPEDLGALARNSGIEALSDLGNGDLLALAEGAEDASESPAFLWRGGAWSALSYRRGGGFRPTGATLLPDGDVLVVERSFSVLEGVRIRLARVPGAAVYPGASLEAQVVATLAPPVPLDNMEGIAAYRSKTGETLVYLISDDNFNAMQRTLLLLFALPD